MLLHLRCIRAYQISGLDVMPVYPRLVDAVGDGRVTDLFAKVVGWIKENYHTGSSHTKLHLTNRGDIDVA